MTRIRYNEKAQKALYYIQNKERKNKKTREWYQNNREYFLEYQRQKRKEPAEKAKRRIRDKMYRAEKRRKLLQDLLGGRCVRCGIDDYDVLQIDHTSGGGLSERQTHPNGGPAWWNQYYLKHPELAKKNLQVLCANCNIKKRIENHELKHYRDVPITWTVRK